LDDLVEFFLEREWKFWIFRERWWW